MGMGKGGGGVVENNKIFMGHFHNYNQCFFIKGTNVPSYC